MDDDGDNNDSGEGSADGGSSFSSSAAGADFADQFGDGLIIDSGTCSCATVAVTVCGRTGGALRVYGFFVF